MNNFSISSNEKILYMIEINNHGKLFRNDYLNFIIHYNKKNDECNNFYQTLSL